MFPRFAAGAAVASAAIALGAAIALITPRLTFERVYPLTILWCFAPLIWGLWALLTPSAWLPRRLPLWGTILGVIGGSLGAFVLNLPSRFLGPVSLELRGAAVLILALFYYVLWMLVRAAYRSLVASVSEKKV